MAEQFYPIPENPVYNPNIRQIQNGDYVDAEQVLGPVLQQVIEDIAAVNERARSLVTLVVGTSTTGCTTNDCDFLCDGVDDQEEINAAIQALPSTGGVVFLQGGVYHISNSVIFDRACVQLVGESQHNTVLKEAAPTYINDATIIKIIAGADNCGIRKIQFLGDSSFAGSPARCAIRQAAGNYFVFADNIIDGFNYQYIIWGSNTTPAYVTIYGNTFKNSTYKSGSGSVFIRGGTQVIVTNNHVNDNYTGIVVECNNITVAYNVCKNNTEFAIGNGTTSYYDGQIVMGNFCYADNIHCWTGISLRGKVIVTNNYIFGIDRIGIDVEGDGAIISNNIVDRCASGIVTGNRNRLAIPNRVSICGNYVTLKNTSGGSTGIRLENAINSLVSGNVCIKGNGQPGEYYSNDNTILVSIAPNEDYPNIQCQDNLIVGNQIMGCCYSNAAGAGNTFQNNKYS